ncbi:MAG TPA: CAP domain-containing protein, partial [Acidimicrobiales bacterium]|nr:CAP domain-containing protein [Acidimicrobiales bacterium]
MFKRMVLVILFVLIGGAWSGASPAAAECGLAALLGCADAAPAPAPEPVAAPAPPPAPAVTPAPAPAAVDAGAAAARFVELVNGERAGAGLGALAARGDLADLAVAHSQRMAAQGGIFHNDALFTSATKSRIGARTVGENVAVGGSVETIHRALMASSGHRANILGGAFTNVGVGVVVDGGSLYVTEVFIASSAAAAQPAAAPAAPRAPASAAPKAAPAPAPAKVVAPAAAPVPVAAVAAPESAPVVPAAPDAPMSEPVAGL